MKRTGIRRKSWIKHGTKPLKSGKPLARKTRIKARGKRGSMYPHRRHAAFMKWMAAKCKEGPRPCDGCKRWLSLERCHLVAKGSGGYDLGNVVLMDPDCHDRQEQRVEEFEREIGVDLHAKARAYAEQFLEIK